MSVLLLSGVMCDYPLSGIICMECGRDFNQKLITNERQVCFEITEDFDIVRKFRCMRCYFYECVFLHNQSKRVIAQRRTN